MKGNVAQVMAKSIGLEHGSHKVEEDYEVLSEDFDELQSIVENIGNSLKEITLH